MCPPSIVLITSVVIPMDNELSLHLIFHEKPTDNDMAREEEKRTGAQTYPFSALNMNFSIDSTTPKKETQSPFSGNRTVPSRMCYSY